MSEFKSIVSSNLDSAAYSANSKTMFVRFKNGTTYRYPSVANKIWQEFEATFSGEDGKSAGKFFNAHIRSLPCEKVEE